MITKRDGEIAELNVQSSKAFDKAQQAIEQFKKQANEAQQVLMHLFYINNLFAIIFLYILTKFKKLELLRRRISDKKLSFFNFFQKHLF